MGKQQRILIFIFMVIGHCAMGQKPVVLAVDKSNAAMNEITTLHGSDFGNDPAKINVFFGAVQGDIKTITNQIIQVRTPAGASFNNISVTNVSNGLTGYSPEQFFLNYKGEQGIADTEFSTQADFDAQSGLYDLCLCDFNNDKKPDVATASSNSNLVTIFENASTPGNIQLINHDLLINAKTLHAKCGDLNGDGKADIVLSEGADGDRIFVLLNTGNFNFAIQTIRLIGRKVKRVAIADLNLDGKPEIVVTDTGGNIVSILPNQSSLSTISFATPVNIAIPQALSTDALELKDLNKDGLPEIITSQYQADNENKLFVCRNNGDFDFSDILEINVNKAISNIRIGDFDGDSKPDIAIARLTGSDISIYSNQSETSISFSSAQFFITDVRPVGIDFGDFDGDGKPDIAVASLTKSISILNNTSQQGTINHATFINLNTTYINRNLNNADMDGDGKPDIIFTSVDDFSGTPIPASKISVIRNKACMVPEVTPGGSLNVCAGNPLQLTATAGRIVNYEWLKDGSPTPVKSGAEGFLTVTASGAYKVRATSESGACAKESNVVSITVSTPGTGLNANLPEARSNSPVCSGNTLNLEVNDVGATEYRWRGPNGFSGTASTRTISRTNFQIQDAGLYIVEMVAGTCIAKTDTTLVEAVSIPDFSISFSGAQKFCAGDLKNLSVSPPVTTGFSFQWFEKIEGLIPGATASSYEATKSGEYSLQVTSANPGCQVKVTTPVVLTAIQLPTADFQLPSSGCVGSEVLFTEQSTGDEQSILIYNWAFGDGKNSSAENPGNIFTSASVFEVSLTVHYDGLSQCSSSKSKVINITAPVVPVIVTSAASMCEGETTGLSISGAFASIIWSDGGTYASTNVQAAGSYQVSTVDNNGCEASDEITIEQKSVPEVTLTADKQSIAAGQSVQLSAGGADQYSWSPGKSLNDSTIFNPVAMPEVTTNYTVTGSLDGGCSLSETITIQVSGEIINIVVPLVLSPNGDDINQLWVIAGVENYPECSLNVFDRQGRKIFETKGYNNDWDGTVKGNAIPQGVYYYVFGCPDKKVLTGTLTVVR